MEPITPVTASLNCSFLFLYKKIHTSDIRLSAITTVNKSRLSAARSTCCVLFVSRALKRGTLVSDIPAAAASANHTVCILCIITQDIRENVS